MKNIKNFNFNQALKILFILIPLGVIANIIFSLVETDKGIFRVLNEFSFEYILLAVLLALVPWITNSIRLKLWTRFFGTHFPIREIFKIVIGCDLGAAVSPTALGGGYVKLAMLIEKGMPAGKAASLMTLTSVEDLIFFILSLPAAIIFTSSSDQFVLHEFSSMLHNLGDKILPISIIIFSIILLLIFIKKIHNRNNKIKNKALSVSKGKIKKFWQDFITYYKMIGKRGKILFGFMILLAAVQWICRYSVITALLACFKVPLHPIKFFLFQWIVFTITTFTPTPGGSIGAEASFYLIYRSFIPEEIIGIVTAGWRFLTFYLQLSLGTVLFYFLHFQTLNSNRFKKAPFQQPQSN
ncbi:MAG: flippase-like domain-containing protein [Candidatus Aminicenantes bacterium]|nr:flippase-like domain-containing protein [Candidatus Aminicenantes bacterium]